MNARVTRYGVTLDRRSVEVELNNSFTVDVPVEKAWHVLSDVPTIAPCLPGAQLQEVEGDEYRGIVKVKVGPITAQYKGKATFMEVNEADRRMVLKAEGRETKGQGNASALITAQLEARGERTEVVVSTDLTVTGKVAQFGRGVMADVSAKLMGQFADNLATTVLTPDGGATAAAVAGEPASTSAAGDGSASATDEKTPAPASGASGADGGARSGATAAVRTFDLPEPEPVDLLEAAGTPTLKRLVPPIVALVLVLLVVRMLRRRGGR
jgi:carbon monoxide dehydrogenase subunit G